MKKRGNSEIKVMLINPPQKYFGESLGFNVYFPLGLLNIAAMIKDVCNVVIFDCLVKDFEVRKEKGHVIYGTPFHKIKQTVKAFNPDIVGITIPFSAQSGNPKIVSRICKEINPKVKVVFGGPHPSVRYETLLEEGSCDFCVIGEGEITFQEFVKKVSSGSNNFDIAGMAYKKSDGIKYKPRRFLVNLDQLPLPAYELINLDDYLRSPYLYKGRSTIGSKSMSMITSRGCPFKCVFCSIELHMGKSYRYHSPDYVIRHLRFCIENLGITRFHFEDDNLSLNESRFEELLDKIIENKFGITWDTPNGIRADTLNYNILEKIKKSGCAGLQIAIESGNQRVLNEVIKKNSSLDYVIKIAEYCKKLKIRLGAFYVIGFPGETIKEIKETIALALRLYKTCDAYPIMLFATPLYGTELYKNSVKEGLIGEIFTDEEIATATQYYGNPLIATKDFSKEDLKRLVNNFELEMNKLLGEDSLRKVLTDKNSLFIKERDKADVY